VGGGKGEWKGRENEKGGKGVNQNQNERMRKNLKRLDEKKERERGFSMSPVMCNCCKAAETLHLDNTHIPLFNQVASIQASKLLSNRKYTQAHTSWLNLHPKSTHTLRYIHTNTKDSIAQW